MTPAREKELVAKYPDILSRCGGDIQETCLAWGMEHGDGWANLLESLLKSIDEECKRINSKYDDLEFRIVAEQIKEKYGSIRFYFDILYCLDPSEEQRIDIDVSLSRIDGMVRMAENLSSMTCEVCGLTGKKSKDIFPHVRCSKCANGESDAKVCYFDGQEKL